MVAALRRQMAVAAERMAFEEAARLRDQVRAIEQTVERQKVVESGGGDQDVIGLHREGGEVEIAILFVREGKVIDRRSYNLEWRLDEEELLSTFLQRFYGREVCIPDRVLLPFLPEGSEVLADWLGEQRGQKSAGVGTSARCAARTGGGRLPAMPRKAFGKEVPDARRVKGCWGR